MGQVDETGGDDLRTRVFLSYSRKDGEVMARVAEGLLAAGFLADYDKASHDPHNVTSGISAEDEWWKRLQEMIAAADVMVFLVSPDSATSQVCDEEIAYARALGKRIIAVLAREVDFAKAPPRLSALNVSIDFTEGGRGFDAAMAGLISALEMNVGWHREGRKYYARVQEWDTRGRPRSLLLREGAVEDAERWALARPRNEPEPGELFLAWVEASRAQIRRDAARRAFWRRVTAVFVLTTLVATLAGAWFVVSGQRDLGRSESLMLARTSERFHNQGDHMRALHLAILASRESFLSPTTDEARAAFAKSAQALKHVVSVRQETKPGFPGDPAMMAAVEGFRASPDGRRLVTWDPYGWVTLWDTASGETVGAPFRMAWGIGYKAGDFNADSSRFLTWDQAGPQLFDTATGAALMGAEGEREVSQEEGTFLKAYFAAGGSRVVTLHGLGQVRLWDAATGAPIGEMRGRSQGGFARVSEDGSTVYGWTERQVNFWDAETGALKDMSLMLNGPIWHAALSPDNRQLVSWAPGGRVTLWSVADGAARALAGCHSEDVNNARFVPQTRRVVTEAAGGQVCVWNLDTGQQVGERMLDSSGSDGVEISPDGRLMFTRTFLSGGHVTSLADGQTIAGPEEDAGVVRGKFSADSRYLVTQTYTQTRIWWADRYEYAGLPDFDVPGFDSMFSPDGRYLAVHGEDGVRLFDLVSGGGTGEVLPHTNYNSAPVFLPDGRIVTAANNTASIWQVRDWTPAGPELPEWGLYHGVILSPDGKRVLSWEESGIGTLWDAESGAAIGELLLGEQGFWDVEFDTGRPQLALRYEDTVQIVSTETGEGAEEVMAHPAFVNWMEFAADGARLLTMADDGGVRLWDTASAALVAEMSGSEDGFPPTVSPKGDRFVNWEGDAGVLYDARTGTPVGGRLERESPPADEPYPGAMYDAVFSADGSMLATIGHGEVRSWRAADGAPIGPTLGTDVAQPVLALSRDGALMAVNNALAPRHFTGGAAPAEEGEIVVYIADVASGQVTGPGLKHLRDVMGAEFSEDGRTLLTWTMDAKGQLWDVASGRAKGDPMQLVSDSATAKFFDGDRRVMVWDQTGSQMLFDTATGAEVARNPQFDFYGTPVLEAERGLMQTIDTTGRVRLWDIRFALRTGAGAADIAEVCAAKLNGPAGASGAPFVRELDSRSVFEAPILRGRLGEDVCTAPAVPWWERAAGAVFGWAFR